MEDVSRLSVHCPYRHQKGFLLQQTWAAFQFTNDQLIAPVQLNLLYFSRRNLSIHSWFPLSHWLKYHVLSCRTFDWALSSQLSKCFGLVFHKCHLHFASCSKSFYLRAKQQVMILLTFVLCLSLSSLHNQTQFAKWNIRFGNRVDQITSTIGTWITSEKAL